MRQFGLLTLKEYYWLSIGYNRREEEKWRHTREILAFISNSRMGVKKMITGKELFPFAREQQQISNQSMEDFVKILKG